MKDNHISSFLRDLDKLESTLSTFDLKNILTDIDFDKNSFKDTLELNQNNYQRISLFKNSKIEMVIVNWSIDKTSNIHDHDQSNCAYKVLSGSLIDLNFKKNYQNEIQLDSKNIVFQNQIGISKINSIHQVRNNSSKKESISIHLYSPPLNNVNIYNEIFTERNKNDLR